MQSLTPTPTHLLSLFQNAQTNSEAKQLHAFSLKTNNLAYPSIQSRLISLYAHPHINNLSYAHSLFLNLQNPNLFLFNILIKSYVENHRSQDALILFSRLVCFFRPDNFTLPCVLKGCARLRAVSEGRQLHGFGLKLGFGSEKFVGSGLVSFYTKCEEIGDARKVFDRMSERDLVVWNSLVDGYVKSGDVEVAEELFDEMPERDLVSWTVLVDGFCKGGKVEVAREVFDRMPERSLVSWNAMINGYMKAGDFVAAFELFGKMGERDLITWNLMICGCGLNGRFVEGLELFLDMLKEGFLPNEATFGGVLSVVSGLASLGKGKWLHSYIVKSGFRLDGVLATSLIDMYSKCGSIESATTIFDKISKKKLGHWTAIIVGLGMHGMAENALKLFHEMRRIRMMPHAITFVGVLNACSHAGLVNDGRRYFNMMVNEYGFQPTVEHYGCFVDILCRAGYLDEAKSVIESMPMGPSYVIWMSLLSGSRIYGNTEMGEYAANHLLEVAPDTIGCYVVLSNIYAAANQWDRVSEVRKLMRKRGVRKDPGCSSIEYKGDVHDFTVGDRSHSQTEEIYAKLREMREKLRCEGHVPDTSQVLLSIEGEEEKQAELESHSERLAIAFGLIKMKPGSPIHVIKNLRVCNDCHSVTKLLSKIYNHEIIVRDNCRFHHFRNGTCSCNDFW